MPRERRGARPPASAALPSERHSIYSLPAAVEGGPQLGLAPLDSAFELLAKGASEAAADGGPLRARRRPSGHGRRSPGGRAATWSRSRRATRRPWRGRGPGKPRRCRGPPRRRRPGRDGAASASARAAAAAPVAAATATSPARCQRRPRVPSLTNRSADPASSTSLAPSESSPHSVDQRQDRAGVGLGGRPAQLGLDPRVRDGGQVGLAQQTLGLRSSRLRLNRAA